MPRQLFAVLRAAIIAPLFISIWTWFLPRWFGGPRAFADPRPLAWVLVAIGAAIALPSIWQFAWRGLGTPAPFDPPRRLVVSGPYRYVRNPMYTGMILVIIGQGLVYPNLTRGMLIEAAAFWAVAALFVLAFEEPVLKSMFGGDYDEYRRAVRGWIPRLTPWYPPPHLE
jgi:protein-S-isoprenylcysteine O-methyltransferase Ste14